MVEHGADPRLGQGARDPLAVHLRAPQGLVGVDVADARRDGLVEEDALDRAVLGLDPAHDGVPVEGRFEQVGRDVRDRRGHPLRVEVGQREAAEGALVDEAQLGAVVGEPEPGVQVPLVGGVRRLDEQLAAHPEVEDEAERVLEVEPEVLAAAPDRGDPATRAGARRGAGAGDVAAGDPVPAQLERS